MLRLGMLVMYDEQTRLRAMELVAGGMTPLEVSRLMGGRPSKTIIRKWVEGQVPSGSRSRRTTCTLQQKVEAVARIERGESYEDVARELGCAPTTLLAWRRLFRERGEDGLKTARDIREELQERARRDK